MTAEELKKLALGTRMIRATAQTGKQRVNSHIPPIYQTVNFDYENVKDGMDVFLGAKTGYSYSRDGNPTADLFAQLVALLEEAEAGIAVASGMAAISSTILSLVKPGDEIVSSQNIYGGTKNWFSSQLAELNVRTRFVDITNFDEIEKACCEQSKILYAEVLGSPNLVIADIRKLSVLAKKNNLIFIVDSTFSPPPIIQPLKLGADIVIHSSTKYINGHGDAISGVIVSDAEKISAIQKIVKLYGSVICPFNAWLNIRGLKTLSVRLEKHNSNALAIAQFLENHAKVKDVIYPGLASHLQHRLAKTQLHGFGGMLAFEVLGGLESGKKIMDAVNVCSFTTSLGEIDTLIMHPASSSHVNLSPEERAAAGVTDGLIRLSVGIEDVNDLIQDLFQALEKI